MQWCLQPNSEGHRLSKPLPTVRLPATVDPSTCSQKWAGADEEDDWVNQCRVEMPSASSASERPSSPASGVLRDKLREDEREDSQLAAEDTSPLTSVDRRWGGSSGAGVHTGRRLENDECSNHARHGSGAPTSPLQRCDEDGEPRSHVQVTESDGRRTVFTSDTIGPWAIQQSRTLSETAHQHTPFEIGRMLQGCLCVVRGLDFAGPLHRTIPVDGDPSLPLPTDVALVLLGLQRICSRRQPSSQCIQ